MSAGDKRRMGPEPLSLPASSLKGFLLFVHNLNFFPPVIPTYL